MSLSQGEQVEGRYRVEGLLGEGGMAAVYRVRHTTLDTLHALKILTSTSPSLRSRLIREGRIQAHLDHPNIVRVRDVLVVHGSPALLMEYVEGPTLQAHLQAGRLPVAEAERLFRAMLDGLEAAHAAGVVHRDLKPGNVLLAPHPRGFVPRISDFGVAKALAGDESLLQTRGRGALGTPAYMAPEQFSEASSADHRADLFAMGCILHEMLGGARTFDAADVVGLQYRMLTSAYVDPAALVPDLPARLVAAIRGCLVPDPAARIPDCATLREVLDGARTWEAPLPTPLPPGEPSGSGAPLSTWDHGPPRSIRGSGPTMALPDPSAVPPVSTLPTTPPVREPTLTSLAPARRGALRWPILALAGLGLAGVGLVTIVLAAGGLAPTPDAAGSPAPAVTAAPAEAPPPTVPVAPPPTPVADPAPVAAAPPPPTPGPASPEARPGASPAPARTAAPSPATAASRTPSSTAAGSPATTSAPATASAPPTTTTAPAAEAAPPGTGTVRVSGGATVRLVGAAGSFRPGEVPPGRYAVMLTVGGAETTAGSVTVGAGQVVELRCSTEFLTCDPAP